MRGKGDIIVGRYVPVIWQYELKAIAIVVFSVLDQEAETALIADWQLHIGAIEHRNNANTQMGAPHF